MTRHPATAAIASLVVLVVLVAVLYWRSADPPGARPLVVYCAASTRPPMEAVARDFEAETGRSVELRFGASEDILTKVGMVNPARPADAFLPADQSYVKLARDRGLVAESFPIAEMRAVVLTAKGNPKSIAAWPDLLRDGVTVAVANPGAAIGKLTRDHLVATGRWATLRPRVIDTGTVTEAANAAKVGSADAAIVWDAVASGYREQTILSLPELDGVTARVEIATLVQSANPDAAAAFVRFVTGERGLAHFRAAGFRTEGPK